MKLDDLDDERRFGEILRAALPPLPADFDPARVEDEFFAALAAQNAAAGIHPPDISARLVARARQAAAARAARAARRAAFARRAAAAAAVVALAGMATAATVALVRGAGGGEPPPPRPVAAERARPPARDPISACETPTPDETQTPEEPDTMKTNPSVLAPLAAAALAAAPLPAPAQEPDPATPPPAVSAADADYELRNAEEARGFLLEWQEALLPLSSAVTQEVGVVALAPDGAEAAAWFASLWPDRGAVAFPALLLDDLGDAVLTNLAAAGRAAAEAPEDYDPAWLLDATLPGIPEEHREALLPFYDPALVTLRFEAAPDEALLSHAEGVSHAESAENVSHAESAEGAEKVSHAETAEGAEKVSHAETAEGAENVSHAESAESLSHAEGPAEAAPPPMPDFKLVQRLLYAEVVAPFYAGPDGKAVWRQYAAGMIWKFSLELGRGRLSEVPNREWGGAYDLPVRYGADDPFLRFCAAYGARKWGWGEKARALRDDLGFRLAGDATPFQRLLLAHLTALLDPGEDSAAALRDAFEGWSAALAGEFDRGDVRAWFRHWLVEAAAPGSAAGPAAGKDTGRDVRAAAIARRAADPAPGASPAPGAVPVREDFVQSAFLPLLLREVVAPLEGLERDLDAPWRAMALAALRDWCLWTARGEDRPDPLYTGRAVSAADRGCPWPAIRLLAALRDLDDATYDPDTAYYGRETPEERERAVRAVAAALAAADADPATTPLSRHLLHRAAAARGGGGDAGSYIGLVASRPWSGDEERVLWRLAPGVVDEEEVLAALPEGAAWLREMWLGRLLAHRHLATFETEEWPLREAESHFRRAAELKPAAPEPWVELLACVAATPAEARAFYGEAARRELDAPGAADAMLEALRPERGGSAGAILAFGDECLATGRFDTRLPLAWAQSRFAAASLAGADWEEPFRGEEAITNMNRVADSILARPDASLEDRNDAFYMRIWPLYAGNDFAALHAACDALGAAEGAGLARTADFDPGHLMRRQGIGLAYGLAGYHHGEVAEALRLWRVEGDPAAAREILRARAGRVSAATNVVDNWEQSLVAGRLAVLDCALARPGETYSLLPKAGTPGPRKFWRSREENVGFDWKNGSWYAGNPGEAAASEPVVPAEADLSLAFRPWPEGHWARFWVVPDCAPAFRPEPGPVRGLRVERCSHGWNAGWDDLALFAGDNVPLPGSGGPRVHLPAAAVAPDGTARIELRIRGGAVSVSAGGEPLPALDRPDLLPPAPPPAVAFAGHSLELLRADVRAGQGPPPLQKK